MKTDKKVLEKRYKQRMLKTYPNIRRLAFKIARQNGRKSPTKQAMITGLANIQEVEEVEEILGHFNRWLNRLFRGRAVNTLNYLHTLKTIDKSYLVDPIVLKCQWRHFHYEQVFFK